MFIFRHSTPDMHRSGIAVDQLLAGGLPMPVHDWTRVDDGTFHDFHLAWVAEIRKALNAGVLPAGYYAQAEQVAGSIGPDVLTLQRPTTNGGAHGGPASGSGPVATMAPPQT